MTTCSQTLPIVEIRRSLERLLESRAFRAAHGQRRFLKYVVEETLAGRGQQIKEFTVGVEAFERGESFDPRVDPIIRTEARKLRARLAKYYEEEGKSDPIRIELPKGSYVPVFHENRAVEESHLASAPIAPIAPPPIQRDIRVPAAIALLVITGIALWLAASGKPVAAQANSVAVMPIVNASGDPGQNPVAGGVTASLIQILERESDVRVIGHTSVSRFTPAQYKITELKQNLGASSILTGSIEKLGGTLRLRVRLADQPDRAPIWSGSYLFEGNAREAIENEIAAEIVQVLRRGKPSAPTTPRKRVTPAAWSAYLEGLHYQGKLDAARAMERFEAATKSDPSFARAYAGLATMWVLSAHLSALPQEEAHAKIRNFAKRALQLDDTLGDPHFSLAVCAQYEYDWPGAEREFREGLALSPSSSFGHLWYAKFLALTGRHREVLAHRTIGVELDPLSPYAVQAVAGYWSVMGEYRQAIIGFQNALALDPQFGLARQGLGIAYLLDGQADKAIAELEAASALQRGFRTKSLLGYAYGIAGKTKEARAILEEFQIRERQGSFPALAIAHVYLGLGDKDHAFAWLEKAVDQRDLGAALQWDSLYAPLRSDPRYSQLLRRMRLV